MRSAVAATSTHTMMHMPPRSPQRTGLDPNGMPVDTSDRPDLAAINSGSNNAITKMIPSAFNRTRPILTSRPLEKDDKFLITTKIPPSVKRKSQGQTVLLWELEDEDDIPTLSDSSGEVESLEMSNQAVLSGENNTLMTHGISPSEEGTDDVFSDLGLNYARVKTDPTTLSINSKLTSDSAGHASSSLDYWRQDETLLSPEGDAKEPSGDIPQTSDEHTARLKEIMHKRKHDKKKRRKKKKHSMYCDDSGSSAVSGASSNTITSSTLSRHTNDSARPKELLHISSETKNNSPRSDGTNVISGDSKSLPKVFQEKASHDDDKASNISGGSATSSIFEATRAKLKSYLTSYSRKKKDKKGTQKGSASTVVSSPLSPSARISPSGGTYMNQGTPSTLSTLFSIDESLDSTPYKMPFESPSKPPQSPRSRKSFEGNISPLTLGVECRTSAVPSKTHLTNNNNTEKNDTTTQIINLPWSHDDKDATFEGKPITGHYSGPVNEFLKAHGMGKIVLKANSSPTVFTGTWENGKLISPLIAEAEHVTSDEYEHIESVRGRTKKNAKMPDSAPQGTKITYAINSNRRISIGAARAREVAALHELGKKRRKHKPRIRYNLGDACRTPQDMIICHSKHEAIKSASILKKWDGAFIKRSCGVWTYAILIERAPQPTNVLKRRLEFFYWATEWEVDPRCELEDSMLFAIDSDGSTKIIPKHTWAKYVRRIKHNSVPDIPKSVQAVPPVDIKTNPCHDERDDSNEKLVYLDDSGTESDGGYIGVI